MASLQHSVGSMNSSWNHIVIWEKATNKWIQYREAHHSYPRGDIHSEIYAKSVKLCTHVKPTENIWRSTIYRSAKTRRFLTLVECKYTKMGRGGDANCYICQEKVFSPNHTET